MKFGKTLILHQIPEWLVHYINYKHLKKVIKSIDIVNYQTENPLVLPEHVLGVLSQFFYDLDRDIERVSEFYDTKFHEYQRRTARIVHVLGYSGGKITHQVDTTDELDEIVQILLEIRAVQRNLKWFGELNHKGFIKILKKLDKKLHYVATVANDHLAESGRQERISLPSNNKEAYLQQRVDALPFANGADLQACLDTVNEILNQLGDQQLQNGPVDDRQLRIGGKRKYSFDKESMEQFYELILGDKPKQLGQELERLEPGQRLLKLLLSLLNKATLTPLVRCIDVLMGFLAAADVGDNGDNGDKKTAGTSAVPVLADPADISGRNFFHQHVVSLGKKQLTKEQKQTPGESSDIKRLIGNGSGPDGSQLLPVKPDGLRHVLAKLAEYPSLQNLLVARDTYERTPLHYAAQAGVKDVTALLLAEMGRYGFLNSETELDLAEKWGDQEGLTPVHLAIIGKHPKTTEHLLSHLRALKLPALLLLATRLDCSEIVEIIINSELVDINYTDIDNNSETALYIALKLCREELVEFLLLKGADPELGESIFGWTPIFIAAAEGFVKVVELLQGYGARFDLVDDSGWLPMEHASLRGHMKCADLLKPGDDLLLLFDVEEPLKNTPRTATLKNTSASGSASTSEEKLALVEKLPELNRKAVNEVYRQFKQLDLGNVPTASSIERLNLPNLRRKMKPIKSFGHRYLAEGELLLLLTLGTTDLRDQLKPIELSNIPMTQSFFTELDTALLLVITCRNKATKQVVEAPITVDLPLEDQHGLATDPITFKLAPHESSAEMVVTFDIVPTYQYPTEEKKAQKILGRGVALLDTAYTEIGDHMRSLHSGITVPLLGADSLSVLGTLRFEYLCARSFSHPQMSISRSDTYWKQLVSTRVIGHRGLGKNMNKRDSLQLGENTVELFIAAASLGASYVEFDVQLTKDFVPVIYHDFLVAESGVDIPMHALTAEQFLGLSEHEAATRKTKLIILYDRINNNPNVTKNYPLDDELLGKYNRPRSMLLYPLAPDFISEEEALDREFQDQISRRMKLTKTWKEKGFKGNARGLLIASNFVTLKELFRKLPKNVGFNIELKYPMLDEAQAESMGNVAYDMNFYVDTILKTVYDENTTGRDILFSLFHPDICLLLSLKQPTTPILFLTEAGTEFMADIRASSLQNAIRFAKKWNLLGIVSAANALIKTPRLAHVVKSSGLVCVTYGVENNVPEKCKIQMKAGVDAVIADSVLGVRESLRKEEAVRF